MCVCLPVRDNPVRKEPSRGSLNYFAAQTCAVSVRAERSEIDARMWLPCLLERIAARVHHFYVRAQLHGIMLLVEIYEL